MQKDFVTATPDTGSSGTTTVNVTAAANTGEARNTAINVSGSSISKTVQVSQAKARERISLEIIDVFDANYLQSYNVDSNGYNWYITGRFRGSDLTTGGNLVWAVKAIDDVDPLPAWSSNSKWKAIEVKDLGSGQTTTVDCNKYTALYTPSTLGGILSITDISDEDINAIAQAITRAVQFGGVVTVRLSVTGISQDFIVEYSIT